MIRIIQTKVGLATLNRVKFSKNFEKKAAKRPKSLKLMQI
tara:strand:- start:630 stop:749 length:120 start_codon:yes stop_codon:yes gene_type:complete